MFRVQVEGRLLIAPTTAITTSADGVQLRIDDERRPEFWLTLFIDRDTFLNLAKLVEAGTEHHGEAQS